jgi:sugar lactone lactonase YvrE
MAVDGAGNLYVADRGNNRVVAMVPSGTGYGAASTVLSGLSDPAGVAADWNGNVYVADTGNNRIVMLPMGEEGLGAAVTIGTGFNNPMGVAADPAGNVYVADTGNNRVVELPRIGSGFGSPVVVGTGFKGPAGVAVDSDKSLYIADTGNGKVIKEPFTAAGYGAPVIEANNLTAPTGVAVDGSHNLYIAETGNDRVVEIPWLAAINRFGGSVVIGGNFASPQGVAADGKGNTFIADGSSSQIWEVAAGSAEFGSVNANSSSAAQTYSFSISAGTTIGSVGVLTEGVSGKDFADAGSSTCVAQTYGSATICSVSVSFTPLGSGQRFGAAVLYDALGNPLATAYLSGTGLKAQTGFVPGTMTQLGTQLSGPSGVAVDGNGNVYIADTGNNRVVELPWTGNGYGAQTTVPMAGLSSPMGLAVDGAGNLYVASNDNDKVIRLPWTGTGFGPQTKLGVSMYGPTTVTVDGTGSAYVADTLDNRVEKLQWTGTTYSAAQFLGNYVKNPGGATVDGNRNVYFTMPYLNSVVIVRWSGGRYQPQASLPVKVSFPSAIVADGNSNLYILDTGNNRVIMLPWTGSGLGAQITVASGFNAPVGLTIDATGNLYVADTGNNQVVKIDLSWPGAMSFEQTYLGSTSADSTQIALVENIGNLPFSLASVNYPVDFPEEPGASNACGTGQSLTPGQGCQLAVNFTPQVPDAQLSETVSVADETESIAGMQHLLPVSGASLGRLSQTISFSAIPGTSYGAAPLVLSASTSSGLPISYQVISGPASLNRAGQVLSLNGAGTVVVQAMQAGNATYLAAASVTQSFIVSPAVLTVTANSVSAVYGAIPAVFGYKLSGFVLGQNAAQAVTGSAFVTAQSSNNTGVGSYSLTVAQGTLSSSNYSFVFVSGTLTVTKAWLQARAGSTTSMYGRANPAFSWSLSGLVKGDQASVVSGAPALVCLATLGSPVGKYPITPSLGTLTANNYNFTFVVGNLTVIPAVLTVTATNQSMVYGASLPLLSYTISGFVTGDSAASTVHGVPALATKATAGSAAGIYAITPSLGTLSAANYTFILTSGVMTVQKAVLTVTPMSTFMIYGQQVPILSYTFQGFVNKDTHTTAVSGAPALSTLAVYKTKPGNVAITAKIGSLTSANYNFVFGTGTLTIGKATLTVNPRAIVMSYGSKIPALAFDLTGFVNGDSAAVVSGAPLLTTPAVSASPVGNYTISGTVGTLASAMYSFAMASGNLTIQKAVLTVTANSVVMIYGGARPALTYTVNGFANAEPATVVSGLPLLTTTATAGSPTGAYAVNVDTSKLVSKNYSFATVNGTITVGKAVLTVTPAAASMIYGASQPALTFQMGGFVNGDGPKMVNGAPVFKCGASSSSPVGQYPIVGTVGSLSAANYSFQVMSSAITVNKAVLTVTASGVSMTYGGALPPLTYTVTGYVNGDTAHVVTGAPILSTVASKTSPAGAYTVTSATGTLSASNYGFVMVNGQLTVNQAVATVTADSQSMIYGAALPAMTYTVSGLLNGDTAASAIRGAAQLTASGGSRSPVGQYTITPALGTLASTNYSFRFIGGSLTIAKAALTVTADNLSMQAGSAVPALTYTVSGMVNGDSATSATKGTPGLTTTALSNSSAGSYPINITQGGMTAGNYTLNFVAGTLTVVQSSTGSGHRLIILRPVP